jgi:hypothetical protein
VAVIFSLEFQFLGDHLPYQFVSRHSESLGIRLGECVRSEQLIDTMTVAGPRTSHTANDDASARRVLNQLCISSFLP